MALGSFIGTEYTSNRGWQVHGFLEPPVGRQETFRTDGKRGAVVMAVLALWGPMIKLSSPPIADTADKAGT